MPRATPFAVALLAALAAAGHVYAQAAAGDRYGAQEAAPPTAGPAAASPLRGRMLAWPGKASAPTAPTAVVQAYAAPQPYRQVAPPETAGRGSTYASAPAPRWGQPTYMAVAPSPQPTGRYGAETYPTRTTAYAPAPSADGWRPVFAAPASAGDRQRPQVLSGAPSPAPLPTSIYSPAPSSPVSAAAAAADGSSPGVMSPAARAAALPPPRGSAAQRYGYDPTQDHAVRFYSVHRPFGLQPDPAPIPPQFFTATADLATPPGPLTTERTTTTSASGATTHAVRATPDGGAD